MSYVLGLKAKCGSYYYDYESLATRIVFTARVCLHAKHGKTKAIDNTQKDGQHHFVVGCVDRLLSLSLSLSLSFRPCVPASYLILRFPR